MSQNNNFAYDVREKSCLACIIQQPVNALAGSRRIGMKTAMPGVDYRSQ